MAHNFVRLAVDDGTVGHHRHRQTPSAVRAAGSALAGLLRALWAALSSLLAALRPPPPPLVVAGRRFRVLRRIGEGGFGTVDLVQELPSPSHGRNSRNTLSNNIPNNNNNNIPNNPNNNIQNNLFAAKRLRLQLPEHTQRLHQEVAAHAAVSHSPHVLNLVAAGRDEGRPNSHDDEHVLILPFCRNGSLQHAIDRLPAHESLPPATVLRFAIDAAAALAAFHAATPPLAFRDLKPANILITDDGLHAILADLGSVAPARTTITSRQHALALQELCAETVSAPFRAPELFDPPTSSTITESTDIWALGCTIYTIAYKTPPFDGSMTATVSGRIHFPSPVSCDPYGPLFRNLVERILVVKPECRPTLSQIQHLLSSLLESIEQHS